MAVAGGPTPQTGAMTPTPDSATPSFDPARLAEMRRSYARTGLTEDDLAEHWWTQLGRWLADAQIAGLPEPNAMVLATAAVDGQPSARTVLLKGYDERGIVCYTNYNSQKGQELAANPKASCVFPWHALERQVCVVGTVTRVSREESVAYFSSRPHGSRLGAWASEQQSAVIPSRAVLEERMAELAERYPDGSEVPLPDYWGGVRLGPTTVEFWQGRENRLHDRLRFRRTPPGGWIVERLSP